MIRFSNVFKRCFVCFSMFFTSVNLSAMTTPDITEETQVITPREQWLSIYRMTLCLFENIDTFRQEQFTEKFSRIHKAICNLEPFQRKQFIQEYTAMLHDEKLLTPEFKDVAERYKNLTSEQKNKILLAQETLTQQIIDTSSQKDEIILLKNEFAKNHINACVKARKFSQKCFDSLKKSNAHIYSYCPFFLGMDNKDFIETLCWFWETFSIDLQEISLCSTENQFLYCITSEQQLFPLLHYLTPYKNL